MKMTQIIRCDVYNDEYESSDRMQKTMCLILWTFHLVQGFSIFPTSWPTYVIMHSYKELKSTCRNNVINELLLLVLFLLWEEHGNLQVSTLQPPYGTWVTCCKSLIYCKVNIPVLLSLFHIEDFLFQNVTWS